MTALFFALALLGQPSAPETSDSGLNLGLFFQSAASADLETGLNTMLVDTLTVFPRGSYSSDWVDLSAEAALEYSEDSMFTGLNPVSAGGFFKWPGSPWIGTGVSIGLIEPFLPGLDVPVKEWRSHDVQDSTVVTIKAGGLLGFQGFWNQFGDSLSWYGVNSPWLGFGTVSWNGIRENSSELETFSGFLDLKKVQPWFLFVRESSQWSYLTEIRGWQPLRNQYYSIELAPEFCIKEDSSTVGITAYLHGRDRAISGSLKAVVDVEGTADPSFSAGLDVLSEAGITWSVSADVDHLEDFHGIVSAFLLASPAGCGGALEVLNDTLRATTTALYSPVPGVSTEISVMANLDVDSPQPGYLLRVFGARDDVTASIEVEWGEGFTILGMEVSAWID